MKIALIGRGRLATSLLPALQQAGHEVVSVNSRTLAELPAEADVFIVSVKDAALDEVVARAAKGRGQQLFVHTAGSMPMDVLRGHCRHYGVFYPLQTFSKERIVDFRDLSLFLEASDEANLTVLYKLARSLSTHVFHLSSADRKYLHLAAVFACNFVNHCYDLAGEVLQRKSLPFDVLLPLIDETARKVHSLSPRQAQTGPAVRYDENVIRMQSEMLSDAPLTRELYDRLSVSIHQKQEEHD